jgi:hypothetical protein
MTETAAAQAQTTPDLGAIMQEGLQQFDVTPEPPAAEPKDDKQSSPDATAKAPTAAVKDSSPAPTPDAKRFTDQDEAEKGYRNLLAEFTRVSQKNKELTGILTTQQQAEQQQKVEESATQSFEAFAIDRRTKLLDEIDALDPDAPDYRKQVASAQARTDRDILQASMKYASIAGLPTTPATTPAPAAPTPAPSGNEPSTEQITAYVREAITAPEIGLAADDILFWNYAAQAPDKDVNGKSIPLDEQIRWAVEQTQSYHAKINPNDKTKEISAAASTAAANSRKEMPLGRASSGAPPPSTGDDNTPVSLNDAIDSANNLRRL